MIMRCVFLFSTTLDMVNKSNIQNKYTNVKYTNTKFLDTIALLDNCKTVYLKVLLHADQ